MTHYHILIWGEVYREKGALTLTQEAAQAELDIELYGPDGKRTGRKAEIKACNDDCFGRSVAGR